MLKISWFELLEQNFLNAFVDEIVAEMKAKIGNDKVVVLGLSGGVDSTVATGIIKQSDWRKLILYICK